MRRTSAREGGIQKEEETDRQTDRQTEREREREGKKIRKQLARADDLTLHLI